MTASSELREVLESGIAQGTFTHAVAWIAVDHAPAACISAGAATPTTVFDLASLTKPMAIGTLAMRAVGDGRITLDQPVTAPGGREFSLGSLLGHRSGLAAWDDLGAWLDQGSPSWTAGAGPTLDRVDTRLAQLAADADPTRGAIYSDLGYILAGRHLEATLGCALRDAVPGYRPHEVAGDPATFAPCGVDPRRGRGLVGEVHDTNTWILGSAAGHAGLFGTADQVGAWALGLERAFSDLAVGPEVPDGGVVRAFWDPAHRADGGTWVLGWDTPSPGCSTAGRLVGPRAVGHLGFTGTSVWIDPERGMVVVLLTNRVAGGSASGAAMRSFRPSFHDAAWRTF